MTPENNAKTAPAAPATDRPPRTREERIEWLKQRHQQFVSGTTPVNKAAAPVNGAAKSAVQPKTTAPAAPRAPQPAATPSEPVAFDFGALAAAAAAATLEFKLTRQQIAPEIRKLSAEAPPAEEPAATGTDSPVRGPVRRYRNRGSPLPLADDTASMHVYADLLCHVTSNAQRVLASNGYSALAVLYSAIQRDTKNSAAYLISTYWDALESVIRENPSFHAIRRMTACLSTMEDFLSEGQIREIAKCLTHPEASHDGWQVIYRCWDPVGRIFKGRTAAPSVPFVYEKFWDAYRETLERTVRRRARRRGEATP